MTSFLCDAGEVDLIICYDALGSPTRTTQRYGRTGRKHDGRIVTLMTEGYEETVHERGAERFHKMRKAIRNPRNKYKGPNGPVLAAIKI